MRCGGRTEVVLLFGGYVRVLNALDFLVGCKIHDRKSVKLTTHLGEYHLVEPSGFADIAIEDGEGFMERVQATSLVCVSTTLIKFPADPADLLTPPTTYLPSGVTYRSCMPPLIEMALIS